jgi:hypothetical protein
VTEEASERPGRYARFALAGFGLVALLAAVPVGFYCLIFATVSVAGWHGVTPRPIDWAVGLSLFVFPLLLLALGGFSLACVNRRRLIVVAALAAALIVDGGLALRFLYLSSHRHRPPAGVTAYPDVESARRAQGFPPEPWSKAAPGAGPETHSIACSPTTGRCVSSRTKAK